MTQEHGIKKSYYSHSLDELITEFNTDFNNGLKILNLGIMNFQKLRNLYGKSISLLCLIF